MAYGLAFLSMICLVAATLVAKAQTQPVPLLPTLTIQGAFSALLYLPLSLNAGLILPEPSWAFAYAVGGFVLFSTLGGFGLYRARNWPSRVVPGSRAARRACAAAPGTPASGSRVCAA